MLHWPPAEMKFGPPVVDRAAEYARCWQRVSAFLGRLKEEAAKSRLRVEKVMHYRNGREAKNGDRVVSFGNGGGGEAEAVGILQNAVPGNDHCNGEILMRPYRGQHGAALITGACLCDCLHIDDVAAMLTEKGLDKRPAGK